MHRHRRPAPSRGARSARIEVRNPVLALRAFQRFETLPPSVLDAMAALLEEIRTEAAERAEHSWRMRKAPMAVYWRAVSVYAGHIRRAIRRLPHEAAFEHAFHDAAIPLPDTAGRSTPVGGTGRRGPETHLKGRSDGR